MTNDNTDPRALQTLGLLTRGALHEIANPLLALVGSAELALGDAEPGTKLHDRVTLTHRTGTEIAEIVRALQAFIRLEAEPAHELSLRESATEAAALLQRVLPGDTSVSVTGDATVLAAPGGVRRGLVELLVDARDRAPGAPIELVIGDGVVTATGGGELRL